MSSTVWRGLLSSALVLVTFLPAKAAVHSMGTQDGDNVNWTLYDTAGSSTFMFPGISGIYPVFTDFTGAFLTPAPPGPPQVFYNTSPVAGRHQGISLLNPAAEVLDFTAPANIANQTLAVDVLVSHPIGGSLDEQVQVGFLNQLGGYFSTTPQDSFYVSFEPAVDFSQTNDAVGGTANYNVVIHSVSAGVDSNAQVGTFAVPYSAGSFFKSNLFLYDRLEAVMGPKPATTNDVYLYSLKINGVDLFTPSATAYVFSNPGLRGSTAVYQGVGHDVRDSIIRVTSGAIGSTDVEYQNFHSIMPVPEPGGAMLLLMGVTAIALGERRGRTARRVE